MERGGLWPIFEVGERARYVSRMFARIARRYDLLNTLMTAGRHYSWRRLAAGLATAGLAGPALDVATGTGDFAIALAARPEVTRVAGLDFTHEMLPIARRKTRIRGLDSSADYLVGDAHYLPFRDDTFICATVGFGVRNFIDVPHAVKEMARVVRPSGRVAVLEIVRLERRGPFSRLFTFYFRHLTPVLGGIFAGDREAYTYLPESVAGFLSAAELASIMEEAGLGNVTVRKLAWGTVSVITGEKAG